MLFNLLVVLLLIFAFLLCECSWNVVVWVRSFGWFASNRIYFRYFFSSFFFYFTAFLLSLALLRTEHEKEKFNMMPGNFYINFKHSLFADLWKVWVTICTCLVFAYSLAFFRLFVELGLFFFYFPLCYRSGRDAELMTMIDTGAN